MSSANVNHGLVKLTKTDTMFVEELCAKYRHVIIEYKGRKLVRWFNSDTDMSCDSKYGISNGALRMRASSS